MEDRTDVSEINGFPHPFLLDDLDDQSRTVFSPQTISSTANRKVVSVEDSAIRWFSNIMFCRKKNAVLLYSGIASVFFMLTAALLRLSLLHPVTSVSNAFLTLVSPGVWLLLFLYVVLDSICMMCIGIFLLKYDVEKSFSIWNYVPWVVFCGFFGSDLLKKCLLLLAGLGYSESFNSWIYVFIVCAMSFVCSFWITFRFNYQLVFPAIELVPMTCIQAAFHTERDKVFRVIFPVARWILTLVLIAGLPCFGWKIFSAILNVRCYFTWALLCFLQLYSHYMGVSILKGFVLQRYTFELPELYLGIINPLKNAPNLITALESNSITLKAFALWDLRDLAIKSGHPRNWDAVREVCVGVLQHVKSQLDQATSQIQRESYASLVLNEDQNKSSVQTGPTILLANQLYKDKNLRKRVLKSDISDVHSENSSLIDTWIALLNKWSYSAANSHIIFSSYEANLAILCIESLGMLIWHSYDEDGYGVVQKDLGSLISLLLQLVVGLDRYIRHNKQVRNEIVLSNLAVVNGLDSSVYSTINRIACKFGTALSAIGLTPLELDMLDTLTGLPQGVNGREP
uniref:Nucleoporin Ndc1 n=1 Tax=Syphacia muris TaxID=451379 RepID=A0A0N5AGD6_9BILA